MHTVTHGGNVTNRLSTKDDLAEIRARVDEATEGPWGAPERDGPYATVTDADTCEALFVAIDAGNSPERDMEFIAHARTDVPRLLDAVEAVLAILNEYPPPNADAVGEYSLVENARRAVAARIRRAITSALGASE